MSATISADLLAEAKTYLDITWTDAETDAKLTGTLQRGIAYISDKTGIKKIELSQNKLSAFMPISMGMLDLGPVWLDNYVRTCLSEALALGYEKRIVTGKQIGRAHV